MRIINTSVCAFQNKVLVIGFEGENERTQVRIDASEVFTEYPHATPSLTVKPYSGEAYPAMVNRDGTDVVWDITSSYLTERGECEIQLTFIKDSVVCKSYIGKALVLRSLTVEGEMPTPVESWVDAANAKLAEVDSQIIELEGMVDTATDAATRAEQSASTASTKAEQAAGSAATATAKANEATQAAGTATAKAAEAQTAAQTATAKATAAAESERIATAKAGEASQAANTATTKAEQATEAAQTATEKAGDASASATAAHASATDAASSATAASASETAAKASETAASTFATQAAQSVLDAGANAQTATQKAAEATQSATNAAASATSAATSAETASTKAGEAAQSAQAVAETAEQLADSLEQIDQNTQDIADLDERKANIDGYYPDMTVGNAEQLNSSKFVENSEPYTLRPSGGTSDIGNREYLDAVVGGTLAWNQAVRDEASENQTDFAPIVTVTDAVEDTAGVKVKLEPVQDLHGYDHPWPAGGGKNKFETTAESMTESGVTWTVNEDGSVSVSGTAENYTAMVLGTARVDSHWGTVTISGISTATNIVWGRIALKDDNDADVYLVTGGSTNPTISVDLSQYPTATKVYVVIKRNNNDAVSGIVKPMVEIGSTASEWTPYSNICPITGWDGVQVWDDPKHGGNVEWNQNFSNGNFESLNGWRASKGTLAVADNVATITASSTATTNVEIFEYPVRHKVVGHKYLYMLEFNPSISLARVTIQGVAVTGIYETFPANAWKKIGLVFTCASDALVDTYFFSGSNFAEGNTVQIKNCMLFDLTQMFGEGNEPTTVEEFKVLFPADYYPYNAGEITTVSAVNGDPYRHYFITLPTEAGTVYGGTLDVSTGELVVDRASVDLASLVWTPYGTVGTNRRVASNNLPNVFAPSAGNVIGDFIAENYKNTIYSALNYLDFSLLAMSPAGALVKGFDDVNYPTGNICYRLAEPITYTLTPTEIRTLLGQNNVWADTGDVALTYTGTDEHLTLESGKKYLARLSGTDSMLLGSGQEITAAKGTDNVFDLTQMFGTAVADYVYGQGAAFFRKWFPKPLYPYNAGELKHVEGLQSHDMVGFNAWDEEWELGTINSSTGENAPNNTMIRSKNHIPVVPGAGYYLNTHQNLGVARYGVDKTFISFTQGVHDTILTIPNNVYFIRFYVSPAYGTTYKNDICINLSHSGARNGEYAPYEKHSYPLDSSVILRGIPKVGANGVYWDGDRYLPDGTVERRYGVVDLGTVNWLYRNSLFDGSLPNGKLTSTREGGTLAVCSKYAVFPLHWSSLTDGQACVGGGYVNSSTCSIVVKDSAYTDAAAFKAAMSGVYLVYELATPTTETAQPYHSTQWVSDWGTEEFVSTGIVPVGTETRYPANLRDKLQHLPDAASGNGSYLITQTDGQMVLTPFPAPPSTAGNYVLKATVTNGVATYTWEVAT